MTHVEGWNMDDEFARHLLTLRAPFPPEQIGKLPKGGIKLDYVSHAWVTDRLLQVDPTWSWEPMGVDSYGCPVIDDRGGLWIRLTVCGVTRIGYGNGTGPEAVKIAIGDAIRNAAMRFGVALDLWEKETPPWEHDTTTIKATRAKPKAADTDEWHTDPPDGVEAPPVAPPSGALPPDPGIREKDSHPPGSMPITAAQVRMVNVLAQGAGIEDRALLHEGISKLLGREVNSVKHLTKHEAGLVIESLQGRQP